MGEELERGVLGFGCVDLEAEKIFSSIEGFDEALAVGRVTTSLFEDRSCLFRRSILEDEDETLDETLVVT